MKKCTFTFTYWNIFRCIKINVFIPKLLQLQQQLHMLTFSDNICKILYLYVCVLDNIFLTKIKFKFPIDQFLQYNLWKIKNNEF